MTDLNNKRVLILGAGREGSSAARFVYRTFPNARITIADQNNSDFTESGIETLFGEAYPRSLKEWDITILSPGIQPDNPLLASANETTTATNLFMEHCKGTVVGVTGSKGKSTTSALIAHILKQADKQAHLLGNIGYPALDGLQQSNTTADLFIFEMSSYQTRLLHTGPDIAVVTALFPDHINYHGSVEQYYTDKLQIAATQTPKQELCFNETDTEAVARLSDMPAEKITWHVEDRAHERDEVLYYGMEEILPTDQLPLLGKHNISNVLAAITVCKLLSIDKTRIAEGIRTFTPLPHRLEEIATVNGVTYINDSLATTPEATIAAIDAVAPVGVILLGGTDRGYDFSALGQAVADSSIHHVILFPESGPAIQAAIEAAGGTPTFFETEHMGEAVRSAAQHIKQEETCLLSCAAPSFSLFEDYADRGDQFRNAVLELS